MKIFKLFITPKAKNKKATTDYRNVAFSLLFLGF